jgi:hypothetical protein
MLNEEERRRGFAEALRSILSMRNITPSGPALAAWLHTRGVRVHPHTLKELLEGKRTPRPSTVERLLQALDATEYERALLTRPAAEAQHHAAPVSLVDAFASSGAIDRARVSEEVLWHYTIGDTDEDDACRETRRTRAGPEGLQVVSFGPGQFGGTGARLFDLPKYKLQVTARRLSAPDRPRLPAQLQVLQVEPARNRLRTVVLFAEPVANEIVEWTVSYRWPGLWRSLRVQGTSVGSLRFGPPPAITKTSVVLDANTNHFGDLKLVPLTPDGGHLQTARHAGRVVVTWEVRLPPNEVRFEVRSDRHRRSADQ